LAVAVLLAQFATLTMEDLTRETIATFMAIQLKQSVAPVSRIGNDVEDVKGFEDASQLSNGPAQVTQGTQLAAQDRFAVAGQYREM
jgi:hypothetical protein